jgi:hypothetical protein
MTSEIEPTGYNYDREPFDQAKVDESKSID